jgi:hypothetical protein
VVELGVRSGNSTAALMAAVEKTGGHLWSVDIMIPAWPLEFYGRGFATLIIGDDLEVADQVGPQIEVTTFADAEPRFIPGGIDVLFIDTSHHYEQTLNELNLYGPRARTILLHDTELEEPYQAPPHDPKYPVSKAIDDWCAKTGRNWINRTGCYGLGVVTKGW